MASNHAELVLLPEQHTRTFHVDPTGESATQTQGQALHFGSQDSRERGRSERYSAKAHAAVSESDRPNIAFHTYVVYRCNRWGTYERWLHSCGVNESKPRRVISSWGIVMRGHVSEDWRDPRDSCPVNEEEALETRKCVRLLPTEYRDAMIQEHVIGGKQQEKADALKIDRTTFWRHCERSYVLLLGIMNDVAAGVDE